ncbi:hypothetical protein JCM3774_004416 [Rhodotorula dairenensis]
MNRANPGQSKWAASADPPPRRSGAPGTPRPAQPWRQVHAPRPISRSDDAQISRDGLRQARRDIGRKPDHFEMLLSPSRGIQDDESSLRNPKVQEQYRTHIQAKLKTWATGPRGRATEQQELGTILLDFRKLREGVTSSRRVDAFACEVYEASILLALANANEPQLASSLPHLVLSLYPSYLAAVKAPSSSLAHASARVRALDDSDVSTRLASLSLPSSPSNGAADPAHRAFFVTLHLLHSSLLPSESAPPRSPATSESSNATTTAAGGPPPASTFLPAFEAAVAANRLALPRPPRQDSPRPYSRHQDPHLDFLLRLRVALEDNQYSDLASTLLSLAAVPSAPPAVLAHLETLHLSTRNRPERDEFQPLATLLQTFVPRLRQNRIWPVVQRAYRFPPDPTEWLGSVLLFEFEVELEETRAAAAAPAVEETKAGPAPKRAEQVVVEDWDADQSTDEAASAESATRRERIRKEAAIRAALWVAERAKR